MTSEEVSKEDLEETVAGYVLEFELKTNQAVGIAVAPGSFEVVSKGGLQ